MIQNSLQSTKGKPKFSVAIQGDAYKRLINDTLGDPDRARRFVASISSAVAVNPALQECDAGSILTSALLGEALNLSPSPQLGYYYMVPYKDKKRNLTAAQFQIGYKGLVQLAIRTKEYAKIVALPIKRGEFKGYDPLTEELEVEMIRDDDIREAAPTVGYYAMFELRDGGFKKALYWSRAKMMKHADRYSKAFSAAAYEKLQKGEIPQADMWKYSSFWYADFDSMGNKTMLRQLLSHWGPMSTELQEAFDKDGAVMFADGTVDYLDTPAEDIPAAPAGADVATGAVDVSTGEVVEASDEDPLSFFN